MSNPFNPFQTRSALRFSLGARRRLCKLLVIKHLQSLSILHSPIMVIFRSPFYSTKPTNYYNLDIIISWALGGSPEHGAGNDFVLICSPAGTI